MIRVFEAVLGLHFVLVGLGGALTARGFLCRLLRLRGFLGVARADGSRASLAVPPVVMVTGWMGAYMACALLFVVALALGGETQATLETEIMPARPAEAAGMVTGDVIGAVDGTQVRDWSHFRELIAERRDPTVRIEIWRNGAPRVLEVTPGPDGLIGVASRTVSRPLPLFAAALRGATMPAIVVGRSLRAFWAIAGGRVQPEFMDAAASVAEAPPGFAARLWMISALASYSLLWLCPGDVIVYAAYLADRHPAAR